MEVKYFNAFNPNKQSTINSRWACEHCKNVQLETNIECLTCGAPKTIDAQDVPLQENINLPEESPKRLDLGKLRTTIRNMGKYLTSPMIKPKF